MSKLFKGAALAALAGSMAACVAPGAFHGNAHGQYRDAPAKQVSYADLRLDRVAGADTLMRRVSTAARQVCGYRRGYVPLSEVMARKRCYREAYAGAVYQVNAPVLVASFEARHGWARSYAPGTTQFASARPAITMMP